MKPVMLQNLLDKVLDRSFQQHQQQQQMPQQPQSQQQQQQQQQQLLLRVAGAAAPTRSDHGNSGSDAFTMKNDHALSAAAAAAAAEGLDHQQRLQQQQLLLHRGSQRLAVEHAQNAKALQQQQQHYMLQQAAAVQQQQQQQQAAAAAAAAAFGRQALSSRTSGGESSIRSSPYGIGGAQLHQQLQHQQQQQMLLPGMGPQHAMSAAHHLAATAPVLASIHHAGMPAAFGYDQLMAARQPSPRGSIVTGLTQPQPIPSLVSPPGSQQQQQQPFSLRRSPAGMPSEMPSPRQTNASRVTSHSPAHGSGDVSLDHHQQQQRSAATAVAAAWHHQQQQQQQQQQRRAADSRDAPAISPSSRGTAEPALRHVAYDQRTPPGYGPLPVGAHGPCGDMLILSPHQQQRGPTHQPPPPDVPTRGGPESIHVASSSSSSPPSSVVARPAGSVAFVAMPRPNTFKGFHVANGTVLGTALPPGALPSMGPGSHTAQQPGVQQQRLGMPVQSQGLRAYAGPSHDGVVGYGSGAAGDDPSYRRRMDVDGLAPASWHRSDRGDSPSREAVPVATVSSGSAPAKSPAGTILSGSSGAPPAHSPTASGALHRQQPAAQPQRRSASASPSPTSVAASADVSGQHQQLPVFLHPGSSAAMNAMHQQQQQQQLLLMQGGTAHFAAPYAVAMQRQSSQLQQATQQHSSAPAAGRRLPGSGATAAEVSAAPQRQQQALSTAPSVAEFSAQQRRTSPPSPAAGGSVYRQSPVASHAPARHAATAASADAVSGGSSFGAAVTASVAASRPRSPRGMQQRPSAADEAQPLDLSAKAVAEPSPSEALLSSSLGDDDDSPQAAAGDALSYGSRGLAPDDDQPLDLTVSKMSPRPPPLMLNSRADHDQTSLLSSAAPEKDPRAAQLLQLTGGNRPPVDGSGLAAVHGTQLSQGGGRPVLGAYTGSLAASSSDAADAATLGVTSPVAHPSLRRPATTVTAYVSGIHSSDTAVPLLHLNHAARYGSGSLVSHDTHPLVLDAVAASTGSLRGAALPTMPQPLQLTAAAAAATAATTGNATQGFGTAIGSASAGCLPASGGSDPTPATLDGSRNNGLVAAALSRDVPSSANACLSPLGQGQPQPPLSSSVTSLIGSHPLSDILFLHCTRCQSSYGSVHGFRKHFRNAHGHNPSADDVQVQSISATRELVRRQRDAGTAASSIDGQQHQLPQTAAPLLVGPKQPLPAFGARVGDAAQHASEQQCLTAVHNRVAANGRRASWEEGGGGGSGSAAGISSATGSRGGSSSSLLADEQHQQQLLHADGGDSRQSPLQQQQQQQLGALSVDRFCLHCLYCGRQYPSVEGVAFEEHVLQHERQLSGGGGAQQQQPTLHHQQQQHRDVHTYRCYYCGERAADAGALREHLLQHDELMHYVCSHCAVAYPTAAAASEHASACHRHHQGLLRFPSTSTASHSPLGEEVPPSADFSSSSDSGSIGRPTDDLEIVSRLPVVRSLQPPNGLAAYARPRPDASPLIAVSAQPHSRDAHGTSKQLQSSVRMRNPAEPPWDAAAGQQSPAAAMPSRSPDSDLSSQSSSPLSRREPSASAAEQLAPTEADGMAPFGAAGTPKYTAGSRRSRAPYTLAQHIEAAVIRELSKANDGSDEATGGSRAEAVVRAAAGVELDQLLLHQQQTTGSTGPITSTTAGSPGSGVGQATVASLTPYSSSSNGGGGGGSTTVNLMAILDRVVEHGLRSFDTSCTAAVTDGAGGIAIPADVIAVTQEAAVTAIVDNDERGSRGAMHVSSPAVWMQNVANGHLGASPEHFSASFAPRAAVAGSNSSNGYGRGGSGSNDRRENENDDAHDMATSTESTLDPSSLCETSNGPTFSSGSTEKADDDSVDEAEAVDSALAEPPIDSSQHSLSRDVDSAAAAAAAGAEQTDPTAYRRLASSPPVQHSLSKIVASAAALPAAADESAGKSGNNCMLVVAENLNCSQPRIDSQEFPTSLPRPMCSLSKAMADQAEDDASGGEGGSHGSDGAQPLAVDDGGRHDSTAATAACDVEPERCRSSAGDRGSTDRASPTTESRFPAPKVEASPPDHGAATPKVLAASGVTEDGDDDDAEESQLGERLLIDEERSCGDDADHCSGADDNVEGPAGAAATAAVADISASVAEADDAVPPAPKIARLALPE